MAKQRSLASDTPAAGFKRKSSIAVSHVVEEDSGSQTLEDNRILRKIVGGTPTPSAKLGGVDIQCVVNTGSMAPFFFHKDYLQAETIAQVSWNGANGLEIPYLGYLEVEVEVEVVKVLVLKDNLATVERNWRAAPGLLGTNMLARQMVLATTPLNPGEHYYFRVVSHPL